MSSNFTQHRAARTAEARAVVDRIVRIYEVILVADTNPDCPFDPFTITLGYPADKLPEAYAESVMAEALKVARKAEVRNGHMDEDSDTVLSLAKLRMKGSRFIPAAQTFEAGVPRKGAPA